MPFAVVDEPGARFIEALRGQPLLARPQDATLILEACFSAHVRGALLFPEHLSARFFDLSSGEAGEVLDKLRRYHVRLAIVCPPGSTRLSSRFREILADDFQLFETRDEARGWLQGLA